MKVLKSRRTNFNPQSSHLYASFDALLEDMDILSDSLSQRLENCYNYYDLLEANKLRSLLDEKNEPGRDQNVILGHLKITIDGHEACAQAVNTAVDGFFFNISSTLDIFSKIAIIQLYASNGWPNFNALARHCNNNTNAFENHIKSSYDAPSALSDIRSFRNLITHEVVFYPTKGKVKWEQEGPHGPVTPYLKIDRHYFSNLPESTDERLIEYSESALLEVEDFLKVAIHELTGLVANAQQIPIQ